MKRKLVPILLAASLLANLVLVVMLFRADWEVQDYHAAITLEQMSFAATTLESFQAGKHPSIAEAQFDSAVSYVYGAYQASYRIQEDEISPWEGLLYDLWNRMLFYPEAVETNLDLLIPALSLEGPSQLYDEARIQQMKAVHQSIAETITEMEEAE